MKQQKIQTSEQIVRNQQVTLLELVDRLLDKGVMVKGEILLSVADIDLVYLNLGLLLSSVKSVEEVASRGVNEVTRVISRQKELLDEPQQEVSREDVAPPPLEMNQSSSGSGEAETTPATIDLDSEESIAASSAPGEAETTPAAIDDRPSHSVEPKANIDPKNVEKGLAKLILTLVDLIRKLMEKQAIRRIDAGQLTLAEIERVGNTFFLLDEKMKELKETFGLADEDLNLDLGPLGELI